MLLDFLKTNKTRKELETALEVIKEFKNHESENEWLFSSFESWAKLEQLEDYIELLINENADVDDPRAKEYIRLNNIIKS